MTTEELLLERYKLLGNWPQMPADIKAGDIFTQFPGRKFAFGNGKMWIGQREIDNCPLLFKKLTWAEDRKPEELPAYVKTKSGIVYRTTGRNSIKCTDTTKDGMPYNYHHQFFHDGSSITFEVETGFNDGLNYKTDVEVVPATEEEFLYQGILNRKVE